MKKLKVIICGTSFGQFYIEAVQKLNSMIEIVGILARGSERSKKCASYYHIPLYTSIEEIPENVDIAYIVLRSSVLGGNGTELALQLMEKGINVLQEQPVHQKDVSKCLRIAKKNNLVYFIGNLYMKLPAIKCFIESAKKIFEEQKPLYIDAAFASQVSYPMIQILFNILNQIRPLTIDDDVKKFQAFSIMTGKLGNTPLIFRVHNEINPKEPDNYLHFLHRITIGTEGGSLILEDTNASVLWIPRLHVPTDIDILRKIYIECPENLKEEQFVWLRIADEKEMKSVLLDEWVQAISDDLIEMIKIIENRKLLPKKAQEFLSVSGIWHEVTTKLEYPRLNENTSYKYLNTHIFDEIISKYNCKLNKNNEYIYSLEHEVKCGVDTVDKKFSYLKKEEIDEFTKCLDIAIYNSILRFLQSNGVLNNINRRYSFEEIISVISADKNKHIIIRWLDEMKKHGIIKGSESEFYSNRLIDESDLENEWRIVRDKWEWKLGSPLTLDYIINNIKMLPKLVSGKIEASMLLFPEGKMEYANSLYKETIVARYLNCLVAEIVKNYVMEMLNIRNNDKDRMVNILEIGAGTGATTEVVFDKLKNNGVFNKIEYVFTDISQFFISEAKEKYKKLRNVKYQTFNIDLYPEEFKSKYNTVDLIIAAGVLNNAKSIKNTLKEMLKTLKPKGKILITEPTREFAEMLVSQVFMMEKPSDVRNEKNSTFMTAEEWKNTIFEAGARRVIILPETDHALNAFGQKLFIVEK